MAEPKQLPRAKTRGRPPKDADDRRAHKLTPRFTPAELERILKAASKAQLPPNDYVRRAALRRRSRGSLHQPDEAPNANYELVNELRRIGVNLNQLTRIANATRRMPAGLDDRLKDIGAALDRLLA